MQMLGWQYFLSGTLFLKAKDFINFLNEINLFVFNIRDYVGMTFLRLFT